MASDQAQAARKFWEWFAANAAQVVSEDDQVREAAADQLSDAFHAAFPNLTWEVEVQEDDDLWFIISPDGVPDRIDEVVQVARNAPKISGWKIVPFRQRGSLNVSLQMHGRTLTYQDIWCQVETVGWQANIVLHVDGLTNENKSDMTGATFVLIDNALGEFDSMVRLGELDFRSLEGEPVRRKDFFPLSDLPAYIDRLPDPSDD